MRFSKAFRISVCSLTAIGIGALFAGEAAAQSFRLMPSVGLYAPTSDLGEVTGDGFEGVVDFGKTKSTLAFGLAGEVGSQGGGLGLRANLGYATASDVPVSWAGCETCSARSTMFVGTAAASLRPIPRIVGLQPYFLLGAGIKRYAFDREDFEEEGFDGLLNDQTKGTLQLGLGADFSLGGIGLFAELSDYISRVEPASDQSGLSFDSDLQNDLMFTVGVVLGG